MAAKSLETLKQEMLDAEHEYSMAFASGDNARLLRALTAEKATKRAYFAAKKRDFNKRFVPTVGVAK